MSIRLVSAVTLGRHIGHLMALCHRLPLPHVWTFHPFICVWSPLRHQAGAHSSPSTKSSPSSAAVARGTLVLTMMRVWATAADREEPEEARGKGEGDGEPSCGKHGFAKVCMDVVGFENVVESAEKGAVKNGGGE